MSRVVLDAILELLAESAARFRRIEHADVRTSEEAAAARGCPLRMGAKSIVLKVDDRFELFALSAADALRSKLIRRRLGVRRTRFATGEELARICGLEPGAVPPFGEPILPLRLHVDPALAANPEIAFTPGVRSLSLVVATADYLRLARPHLFPFARPGGPRPGELSG